MSSTGKTATILAKIVSAARNEPREPKLAGLK
jgi:hypothetical protein